MSNNTLPTFWVVWNPGKIAGPKFQHHTLAEALTEARRLAEIESGSNEFFVLQAIHRIGKEIRTEIVEDVCQTPVM